MAGLVPAIYVFVAQKKEDVDARHKAGHDGEIRICDYNPKYALRTSGLLLISSAVPCICKRPVCRM
jgi:hypothetical protein